MASVRLLGCQFNIRFLDSEIMCKCIETIEREQLKSKSIRTGKKVVMFEFTEDAVGNFMNFKTGKDRGAKTKSTVRYQLEGQKKINRSYMHHHFCPFCGKAYAYK